MTYVEDKSRGGEGKHPHKGGRSGGGGTGGSASGGREPVDVYLPRRSLQIQSGATRYNFAHSIRNKNLHHPRRVSITFRESSAPTSKTTVRRVQKRGRDD